jgi:serine/threonine-protein kinase HipA
VDALIAKVVQHTPTAVHSVQQKLPQGFPQQVAQSIFDGLIQAANRLGRVYG